MRQITIHDSFSGALAPLEPRDPGQVGIYACGPTVYAPIHIGNARPYVVFALFKRFLEHEGFDVTLVANLTDVNDKIYDAAQAQGTDSGELAEAMIARYTADTDRLGLGRPDHEPKATESIQDIIDLIQALVDGGSAYAAAGDVYFRVRSFPAYGGLSNRELDDMVQAEGDERVDVKESPQDFALWKARKEGEDTWWESPWGEGRPGWHIECSAMAERLLGVDFDVHGGGIDLVFPHHENEIAQTEAARGKRLARLWMHNGMVRLDDEKMSKSLGNIQSLSDALDEHGRDAIIMWFVGGHYRSPLSFTAAAVADAGRSVDRIREFCRRLDPGAGEPEGFSEFSERFFTALADDFNTPTARAALFDWVAEGNRRLEAGQTVGSEGLEPMLRVIGMEHLLEVAAAAPDEALALARERDEARAARDFEKADQARDALVEMGWDVRDTPAGPELVRRDG